MRFLQQVPWKQESVGRVLSVHQLGKPSHRKPSHNASCMADYINKRVEQYKHVKNTYECREKCQRACSEILHHKEVSMVLWPGFTNRVAFYNEFIKGKPYDKHYRQFSHQNPSENSTLDLLLMHRVVTETFLKVTLKVKSQEIIRQTEAPKLEASALMSQLGGALNLYAGITCALIVELIELMYHLCCGQTEQGSVDTSEGQGHTPSAKIQLDVKLSW